MEERGKIMTEGEFKDKLKEARQRYFDNIVSDFNEGILHISNFSGVSKFRSVRRAIRRGQVDLFTGAIYPKRPFNNRKATKGRKFNEDRKEIYGRITRKVG